MLRHQGQDQFLQGWPLDDLVKLVSISFESQDAAIWIHFETITFERLTMPLDFISRIELCNQEEFLNTTNVRRLEFV